MLMEIKEATSEDKEFILRANKEILAASGLIESDLKRNIDRDVLGECEECKCLIIKQEDKRIAMCLYSTIYWADNGKGVYLSQVYVDPEFRRQGIVKKILRKIMEDNRDCNFITCLVGKENDNMRNVMKSVDAEIHDLVPYVIERDNLKE